MDCAKKLGLCKQCLADINLEQRRKVIIRKSDARRKIYVNPNGAKNGKRLRG